MKFSGVQKVTAILSIVALLLTPSFRLARADSSSIDLPSGYQWGPGNPVVGTAIAGQPVTFDFSQLQISDRYHWDINIYSPAGPHFNPAFRFTASDSSALNQFIWDGKDTALHNGQFMPAGQYFLELTANDRFAYYNPPIQDIWQFTLEDPTFPPAATLNVTTQPAVLNFAQPAAFLLTAESSTPIASWKFNLSDEKGHVLVDRHGDGQPPAIIDWDKRADDGGYFGYSQSGWHTTFTVYFAGGKSRSFVDHTPLIYDPSSLEHYKQAPAPLLSNDTLVVGQGGNIHIQYPYFPDRYPDVQFTNLEIDTLTGSTVFTQNFQTSDMATLDQLPTTIHWDGKQTIGPDVGNALPIGDYKLKIQVFIHDDHPIYENESTATIGIHIDDIPAPTPTPTPTPDPASKLHPVLLIHGLNSYPDMWSSGSSDYVSILKGLGYPDDFIAAYHYSGTGVGKNGYNNQGDIPEMAVGMPDAVKKLRDASLTHGGDGQVDIIAHSMGGLIARQYIKNHPTDNHIAKVIAIGTPFQGSFWMNTSNFIDTFIPGAKDVKNQIIESSFGNLDLSQPSEQEMAPSSTFLHGLDLQNPSIQYYALYGNITVRSRIQLFDLAISSTPLSHSDLVVDSNSASYVPTENKVKSFSFNDEQYLDMFIHQHGIEYVYTINQASINNLLTSPYFHINLPSQATIKARVIKSLKDE